ncbi:MFS transporter [Saccharopolyspora sp. K220]|uniref:MFS transporter n=1 Tax=Saccharopolyspora soli TaxID=2926618 RepID=UPI001F5AFC46|nr:MFS transporter [Saccharopolyspora soli]MCI2416371.1 MFS transporter [Saccharopolyspora soli]
MPQAEIDVREELDQASMRPLHWWVVVLALLAITIDGYNTMVTPYVIPFVQRTWELSGAESGLLVSSALVGVMVGSLGQGVIADRIGRKPTLIAGLVISGGFSVLTALLVDSLAGFVALRFLTGIGLGVIMPLCAAYINEFLPRNLRHRIATISLAGFAVGGIIAPVLGIVLAQDLGWRILLHIGGLSVLLGIGYLAVFPESVEYLAARGRNREAISLLSRLRPDRAAAYAQAGGGIRTAGEQRTRRAWLIPLGRGYLVTTLALWATSFFVLFDNYGLITWAPNIMLARGYGFTGSLFFAISFELCSIVGGFACGYVADKWLPQRISMIVWLVLGSLSAVVLVTVTDPLISLISVSATGFFIAAVLYPLNNVTAMSYPVNARSTGVGYMLGVGRLGGILGPYICGALPGASVVFIATTIAGFLAAASMVFYGHEERTGQRIDTVPETAVATGHVPD